MKKKRILSLLLVISVVISSISAMGVVVNASDTDVLTLNTWIPDEGEAYAYLISCDTTASGTVRVPATYEGYPVKYITNGAFKDCTEVTSIIFEGGVEQIQEKAFENCTNLISVSFPDTLLWIANNVFLNCENIKNIHFADNESLFNAKLDIMWAPAHNWNLYIDGKYTSDLVIPEGVTCVEWGAFDCCTSLKSVTFPSTIEEIETFAFYACANLATVSIPDVAVDINERAFAETKLYNTQSNWENGLLYAGNHVLSAKDATGKVTFKEGTVSVASGAFTGSTVTSAFIPDSVKAINTAFAGNDSIKTVSIGSGVEILPFGCFAGCDALATVTLSEGVKRIEKRAFAECIALQTINLPETLEYLDEGAFYECASLATLKLPASLGEYDLFKFRSMTNITLTFAEDHPYYSESNGIVYNADKTELIYVPVKVAGKVTIPATVKKIGENAFKDCVNITEMVFGSGLETIGANAFEGCTGLKDLTFSDGITAIEENAFKGCTGITEITFGKGLATIGDYAFQDCTGLKSIVIPENITAIGDGTFKNCTGAINVVFTDGLTTIGSRAFENCQSIVAVTFPESLIYVGEYAFVDCVKLEYITLNEDIEYIGVDAFKNTKFYNNIANNTADGNYYVEDTLVFATGTNVVIKEGITTIATGAINSDEIVSITLPSTLTYIEKGFNAPNLETVNMQNLGKWLNIEYEDETANILGMCPKAKICISGIYMESTLIPPEVTTIRAYKYANNQLFRLAVIPNTVTKIEDNAFYGCSSRLTIKCGENSAAHKYAVENGLRYIFFDKNDPYNTVIDMEESILETDNEMIDNPDEIVASDIGTLISYIGSHKIDSLQIFGTGSKIVVIINGVRYEFTLVVKGDINGDGTCDALDIEAIHHLMRGMGGYDKYRVRAMDTNSDEEVNVADYQSMVNKTLYKE